MSYCADRPRPRFRADSGVDVHEALTPSGYYGYAWVERRGDGTCEGFAVEWVPDRDTWVLWTNEPETGWTARDVGWPAPGDGGRAGVVRERAGGDT